MWNTDLLEAVELENLLINAAITVHSAEQRKVRFFCIAARLVAAERGHNNDQGLLRNGSGSCPGHAAVAVELGTVTWLGP